MIYRNGDKVKVIRCGFPNQVHGFTSEMEDCIGDTFTIYKYTSLMRCYSVKENHWIWDARCFEDPQPIVSQVVTKSLVMRAKRKAQGYAY